MVRAAAIFRVLALACLLGAAPSVNAQNRMVAHDPLHPPATTSFAPDRSDYEALGNKQQSYASLPQTNAVDRTANKVQSENRKQVMDAIWKASQATGVDYKYLLAKAQLESGLNPDAKARTSSAAGLFQFIEGTWISSLERYQSQIEGAKLFQARGSRADRARSASRSERLEWRFDPELAALVAGAYALENAKRLETVLGRRATSTELYMAHFLGTGGAARFLSAWQRDPHRAAAHIFPRPARANRPIFYTSSGRARSLEGVLKHFDAKLEKALSLFTAFDEAPASVAGDTSANWGATKMRAVDTPSLIQRQNMALDRISSVTNIFEPRRSKANVQNERASVTRLHPQSSQQETCNHIEMCYPTVMSTSTITQVRDLLASGSYTKAGIARAAGLHANTLRDTSEPDWNPTAETLTKLQKFVDANDDTPVLVGAEEIIDEARNGRMYILVDDEDRENEGDLIIPAQMATPAAVNFMATHGRGLICLALDKARVDQLGLDPMTRNNKESMQTAFTVSIEAKDGVTTGISAADRARTISVAIDASKGADDIVTPGHVFPLMAREGGTLVRAGHTEAAVDISRIAGLNPSGVICEIMNEDGTMARLDDLIEFARKHSLKIGTIRDLIAYRMRNDHLVERINESSFESDYGGQWRMITYRNTVSDNEAYVLQKGRINPEEPTLTRVHPISVFDDVLGAPGPRKRTLQRAMGAIGEKGAGVIVILTQRVGQGTKWSADEEHRNIGIGSQILADLGVQEMVLLSNSRPDLVALEGYGITLAGHQPIPE